MDEALKQALQAEQKRAEQLKRTYEARLKRLSKEVLVKKIIRGRPYYYLAQRMGKKVQYRYVGKLSLRKIDYFEKLKIKRAEYRKELSEMKNKIYRLKSAINKLEKIAGQLPELLSACVCASRISIPKDE